MADLLARSAARIECGTSRPPLTQPTLYISVGTILPRVNLADENFCVP